MAPDPQPSFSEQVFSIVARIPRGHVSYYGQVATLMGRPRSGRYVGYALRNCPEDLPAHRVLHKDGSPVGGEAFGGPDAQRAMLAEEGVDFLANGNADMSRFLWDGRMEEGPDGPPPDFDWAAELGE